MISLVGMHNIIGVAVLLEFPRKSQIGIRELPRIAWVTEKSAGRPTERISKASRDGVLSHGTLNTREKRV